MCKGQGLHCQSRIITPSYICMCKGKGLYGHSRISMPNCIHMCKGLGLCCRFYGVKCLLGEYLLPFMGAVMPVFSQAQMFLTLFSAKLYKKCGF